MARNYAQLAQDQEALWDWFDYDNEQTPILVYGIYSPNDQSDVDGWLIFVPESANLDDAVYVSEFREVPVTYRKIPAAEELWEASGAQL